MEDIFNLGDEDGVTPLFSTHSAAAMEMILDAADIKKLKLVDNEEGPLLHYCVTRDNLSPSIAASLFDQREMKDNGGRTAIALGEMNDAKIIRAFPYATLSINPKFNRESIYS
jgi:hypothetical protein